MDSKLVNLLQIEPTGKVNFVSFIFVSLPGIHPIVNEWIEHGVGHGQPVESQVDMLNEWFVGDLFVMVGVDEIHMVRKPADCEDDHHHHEHLYHLEMQKKSHFHDRLCPLTSFVAVAKMAFMHLLWFKPRFIHKKYPNFHPMDESNSSTQLILFSSM